MKKSKNELKDRKKYKNKINIFSELHYKMNEEMKNTKKTIDPIVTLRNLKYCRYLEKSNIDARIAAEISYTARFPENERKDFELILNKLGNFKIDNEKEIEKQLEDNFLFFDDKYKKSAYLALTACKEGFHPLLIGNDECGLTKLAKFIALTYKKEYNFLICNSDTSIDDLIGYYKPGNNNDSNKLNKLIDWKNGPILEGIENGIPVILDNINYSKPQIIEYLNPLLEKNMKYEKNKTFLIPQKEGDNEINIKDGFVIIGTMKNDKNNTISKALMNRFVAIYLDELKVNENNIDDIIIKIGKKLKKILNLII